MKIPYKLLPLVVLLFCGLLAAQQIGSLDIQTTSSKRRREPDGVGGASCGAVDHAYYPEAVVSLLSLDSTQYEFGQSVAFEVKIQNVGKETIILPWAVNLADFEPENKLETYTYLRGTVSLHFATEKRKLAIYSSFYGSPVHAGTLKELRPGEWVTMRARAKLETFDDSFSRAFGNDDFVATEVDADLMLNEVKFFTKGENGKPTEMSTCVLVHTRRANQLKATIFRHRNVR